MGGDGAVSMHYKDTLASSPALLSAQPLAAPGRCLNNVLGPYPCYWVPCDKPWGPLREAAAAEPQYPEQQAITTRPGGPLCCLRAPESIADSVSCLISMSTGL